MPTQIFYDTAEPRRLTQARVINHLMRRRAMRFCRLSKVVNPMASLDGRNSSPHPVAKGVSDLKGRILGLTRPAATAHAAGGLWLHGAELMAESDQWGPGGLWMVGAA